MAFGEISLRDTAGTHERVRQLHLALSTGNNRMNANAIKH